MRLFAALWPPEEARSWLAEQAARVTQDLPVGSRLVPAANLHATLAFYGDRDDPDELKTRLQAFGSGLTATPVGSGAFPSKAHARVVWIGLEATGFADVARAAAEAGGLEPTDQTPHVTLARLKRPRSLSGLAAVPSGPTDSWSIELVRSHLGSRGARYELL
jgi:2'-5' RNA ligase